MATVSVNVCDAWIGERQCRRKSRGTFKTPDGGLIMLCKECEKGWDSDEWGALEPVPKESEER